jgi:hypothetical protein
MVLKMSLLRTLAILIALMFKLHIRIGVGPAMLLVVVLMAQLLQVRHVGPRSQSIRSTQRG